MRKGSLALIVFAATLVGCGGASPPVNGRQLCAPASAARRCPDGFTCASDNHCWRPGTEPRAGDAGFSDAPPAAPPDATLPQDAPPFEATPSRPLPSTARQVPGGQSSSSETYRAVWTAAPPPGTRVMQSETYRAVGGPLGATQR
jgi:hypothetical protein